MSTLVIIPAKGKITVVGMPSPQAMKDLMKPSGIRIYRSTHLDPTALGLGRTRAWEIAHKLAELGDVTIHWEVYAGTGTCTARCWDARRFQCSCSCGGRKHSTKLDWKEIGHNWLEGHLDATPIGEVSA